MAVVRNLMIRIGADYSEARKGMQGATRDLNKFKRDATTATSAITGKRGLGGIGDELKSLSSNVASSLGRIRGAKGVGGVVSEIKTLAPQLGAATKGLKSFGAGAAGAASRLGIAGVAIAGVTAVLSAATVGLYHASQAAVQFEADIGRLNLSLKSGARGYMEWARAQGLAKQSAASLGATYGNLLGSFINDTKQIQTETQNLVQATRIISSNTGRSLEDVFERMRSGLLGNTESIEDLGVFVNISMIESTKAFKKFAGDKSWAQLTFQTQQQIRLAAILEQTYARYGTSMQNNVMTKQTALLEQLKDIKLHLSQAFLPIWEAVLPALTRLAESVAHVTENIARFVYWINKKDYDKQTQGMYEQAEAANNLGNNMDDVAKSTKKARTELAAFDQLNLLGSPDGGSGGGAGGTGGSKPGGIPIQPDYGDKDPKSFWDDIPPLPKLQLTFDLPSPPDAGAGAVATAVTDTVNNMAAQTNARLATMWSEMDGQTQVGIASQQAAWQAMSNQIAGQTVPTMTGSITNRWSAMWGTLLAANMQFGPVLSTQMLTFMSAANAATMTNSISIQGTWRTMLDNMQSNLNAYRPYLEWGWSLIGQAVLGVQPPLVTVGDLWRTTLDGMQSNLNAYRPYLEWGWSLIGAGVAALVNPLETVKTAWSSALSSMHNTAATWLSQITSKIDNVASAWSRLRQTLASPLTSPTPAPAAAPTPAPSPVPAPVKDTGRAPWVDNNPVLGSFFAGIDWVRDKTAPASAVAGQFLVPGAQFGGVANAGKGIGSMLSKGYDDAARIISEWLQGMGVAVPAFASGAAVFGPTLAMVGDNMGARHDPEIIAPQSMMIEAVADGMAAGNRETHAVLLKILGALQSGRQVNVTIARDEIGQAAAGFINDEYRRGNNPLSSL